jgi:hypothetical protein
MRRPPFTSQEDSRLSRPQAHTAAGRIKSIRKSSYLSGNRTRDFPACGIVPQPIYATACLTVRLKVILILSFHLRLIFSGFSFPLSFAENVKYEYEKPIFHRVAANSCRRRWRGLDQSAEQLGCNLNDRNLGV